jgi:hypothetical protein
VRDALIHDCPRAFITPRSAQLVQLWEQSQQIGQSFPEYLGTEEAWAYDVDLVLRAEKADIEISHSKERARQTRALKNA